MAITDQFRATAHGYLAREISDTEYGCPPHSAIAEATDGHPRRSRQARPITAVDPVNRDFKRGKLDLAATFLLNRWRHSADICILPLHHPISPPRPADSTLHKEYLALYSLYYCFLCHRLVCCISGVHSSILVILSCCTNMHAYPAVHSVGFFVFQGGG